MQLTFLGAAGTVTGSRYLVETENKRILVDCGLFQGYKELRLQNWGAFPVVPSSLHAVVLTHAHLDHSGYLPLLVKQGFRGPIYCTPPTFDLCKLLLPDSGYIQEEDARRANKYHYTKHAPALPLYTLPDAEESLQYFRTVPFGEDVTLAEGIRIRFERAGHILGAAWVMLTAENRKAIFSGDLGRPHDPVMKPPVAPVKADYVIVESTYGDRRHDQPHPLDQLAGIIRRTAGRGGTIVIPAFAVGRAQNLMYYLHTLKANHLIPDIPIYLDSPMAINATTIMEKYLNEHRLSRTQCSEVMRSVTYVHSVDESKKLNDSHYPKIIIAASGMATGGRVLHHLKHLAPDTRNTILFAGFQAGGTRGDRLLRGEKEIKIHGEMVPVKADIEQLQNVSAHADYEEVLAWLGNLRDAPVMTFITHGEPKASAAMQQHIQTAHPDWPSVIPHHLQTFHL